jgi:hypothetical protein
MCSENSQCPQGINCDLTTHQCAPSSYSQEISYYDCVYNTVSVGIWTVLSGQLGLPSDATNEQMYSAILNAYVTSDCLGVTGTNIPYHTYAMFDFSTYCPIMGYYGQGIEECLDEACDPGPTVMFEECGHREWVCK